MRNVLRVLACVVALAAFAGVTKAADVELIVVSHGQANDPFRSVVKNGVAKAAKDKKVDVDYRAPETFDMVAMAQLIDDAAKQEPDGLIVSIPDAEALGTYTKDEVSMDELQNLMAGGKELQELSAELGGNI